MASDPYTSTPPVPTVPPTTPPSTTATTEVPRTPPDDSLPVTGADLVGIGLGVAGLLVLLGTILYAQAPGPQRGRASLLVLLGIALGCALVGASVAVVVMTW